MESSMLTKRAPQVDSKLDNEVSPPVKVAKFRIDTKSWFLTYPQCTLDKEEVKAALLAKGKPVKGGVVARELHEDGTPHIHVYLLLEKEYTCTNQHFWDINGFHGNYQGAKSWSNVITYIKKDGNYLQFGDLDLEQKIQAQKSHKKVTGARLINGESLESVVRDYPQLLHDLPNLEKAVASWKRLTTPGVTTKDIKGIWIVGPPGVGKSWLVRKLEQSLYQKAQNKWWDGYEGQPAVCIDDMDLNGSCLSHYIKIWADRYSCTGEIKGSTVQLGFRRFYVTSNYYPMEIFGDMSKEAPFRQIIVEAIERRFHVVKINKREDQPALLKVLEEHFGQTHLMEELAEDIPSN